MQTTSRADHFLGDVAATCGCVLVSDGQITPIVRSVSSLPPVKLFLHKAGPRSAVGVGRVDLATGACLWSSSRCLECSSDPTLLTPRGHDMYTVCGSDWECLAALPPCRLAALPPCRLAALPPCRRLGHLDRSMRHTPKLVYAAEYTSRSSSQHSALPR